MQVSRFGLFAALAASVTLPLAGPVHADAGTASVESVAPLAAVASVSAATAPAQPPAPTLLVSQPIIQALPSKTDDADQDSYELIGSGIASFYGVKFAGRRTASGAIYDPEALTAAHPSLPFGTQLQVTNTSNGESVVVTVTDRGPFHSNRVIDLSKAAAREIGLIGRGSGKVELAILTDESH